MNIRLAVATDEAAIQACASAAYEKYIERIGREPAPMLAEFAQQIVQQQISVMTVDGVLVTYAVSYALSDCYFLENIAVDPAFQGNGYGTKMLDHVHKLGAQFPVIRLYTNEKTHENLVWYKNRGYVETDVRVEDGFTRVYLEKVVTPAD